MHRSCVVCVLVADFDVEEIMEEFTMESITNRQIIEYYSKQPALSSKYVLTNKYTEYRRNAEKIGRTIQPAHKLYNVFENINNGKKSRSKYSTFYMDLYKNYEWLAKLEKADIDEFGKMIKQLDEYNEYNEKWHLCIAYYALSLYNNENKVYNDISYLDLEHDVVNWNFKGNITIKDPLLLLWLTEASGIDCSEVVKIKEFVDTIGERECKSSTLEDDIELLKLFTKELWQKIILKIQNDVN